MEPHCERRARKKRLLEHDTDGESVKRQKNREPDSASTNLFYSDDDPATDDADTNGVHSKQPASDVVVSAKQWHDADGGQERDVLQYTGEHDLCDPSESRSSLLPTLTPSSNSNTATAENTTVPPACPPAEDYHTACLRIPDMMEVRYLCLSGGCGHRHNRLWRLTFYTDAVLMQLSITNPLYSISPQECGYRFSYDISFIMDMFRKQQISALFAVHLATDCMITICVSGYVKYHCSSSTVTSIRYEAFVNRPTVVSSLFAKLSSILPPDIRSLEAFQHFFYRRLDAILMYSPTSGGRV